MDKLLHGVKKMDVQVVVPATNSSLNKSYNPPHSINFLKQNNSLLQKNKFYTIYKYNIERI